MMLQGNTCVDDPTFLSKARDAHIQVLLEWLAAIAWWQLIAVLLCSAWLLLPIFLLDNEPRPRIVQWSYPASAQSSRYMSTRYRKWLVLKPLKWVSRTRILHDWYVKSISEYAGARGTSASKLMLVCTSMCGSLQVVLAIGMNVSQLCSDARMWTLAAGGVCCVLMGAAESALLWNADSERTQRHVELGRLKAARQQLKLAKRSLSQATIPNVMGLSTSSSVPPPNVYRSVSSKPALADRSTSTSTLMNSDSNTSLNTQSDLNLNTNMHQSNRPPIFPSESLRQRKASATAATPSPAEGPQVQNALDRNTLSLPVPNVVRAWTASAPRIRSVPTSPTLSFALDTKFDFPLANSKVKLLPIRDKSPPPFKSHVMEDSRDINADNEDEDDDDDTPSDEDEAEVANAYADPIGANGHHLTSANGARKAAASAPPSELTSDQEDGEVAVTDGNSASDTHVDGNQAHISHLDKLVDDAQPMHEKFDGDMNFLTLYRAVTEPGEFSDESEKSRRVLFHMTCAITLVMTNFLAECVMDGGAVKRPWAAIASMTGFVTFWAFSVMQWLSGNYDDGLPTILHTKSWAPDWLHRALNCPQGRDTREFDKSNILVILNGNKPPSLSAVGTIWIVFELFAFILVMICVPLETMHHNHLFHNFDTDSFEQSLVINPARATVFTM